MLFLAQRKHHCPWQNVISLDSPNDLFTAFELDEVLCYNRIAAPVELPFSEECVVPYAELKRAKRVYYALVGVKTPRSATGAAALRICSAWWENYRANSPRKRNLYAVR